MVAATVRTIFQQPDRRAVQEPLARVVEMLQEQFPAAVALLVEAEEVLTSYDFPREHRPQIAAPTHSNGSTKNSSGGARSSGSSRTVWRCYGR